MVRLLARLLVFVALLAPGLARADAFSTSPPPSPATVLNIRGTDASGVADNSAAFTTALATGKRIRVPAGTYAFSAPMVAPAGVSEIDCDRGADFTALAGNSANALFISTDATVTGMVVKGCSFFGSSATVGVNTVFFQIFHSANVVFDDCYFTDNRSTLAGFTVTTNSGIRRSRFDHVGNFGQGTGNYPLSVTIAYSPSGTNNFFNNNDMTDLGGDVLDAQAQAGFSAIGNHVVATNNGFIHQTSAAGTGLYVYGGSVGVVVANNYIYGLTGNGIDLNCFSQASVTGNVSLHNGGAGISLSGDGGVPCSFKQFSLAGNTTNDNWQGAAGLVTIATNGTTAAGNAVLNFAATTGVVDGYFVFDASSGVPVGTKVLSHTSTTVTLTANAVGSGVASAASIQFLNGYPRTPAPNAGVWLGCANGACTASDFTLSAGLATDTQGTKTQPYGIAYASNLTATNYKLSADYQLAGNNVANTLTVLPQDQGSGSNGWACWPGSGAIASGNFGSMACGFSATASGVGARAMGTGVTASGQYGDVSGSSGNDRGNIGKQCYATGQLAASGDAQTCASVLRGTGATGSAFRLTANGAAASGLNCINLANNSALSLIVTVTAFDHTTVTKNEIWPAWTGLITRGANAAATAVTMNTTPTPITNGTVTGSAIAATADTTNGCLNISFTPPTSNTDTWNVVARVETVEVQ